MWLEHRLEDSATLIVAFQVQGRLAAIAKPLPNKYVPVHLVQCICTCVYYTVPDHTVHARVYMWVPSIL